MCYYTLQGSPKSGFNRSFYVKSENLDKNNEKILNKTFETSQNKKAEYVSTISNNKTIIEEQKQNDSVTTDVEVESEVINLVESKEYNMEFITTDSFFIIFNNNDNLRLDSNLSHVGQSCKEE